MIQFLSPTKLPFHPNSGFAGGRMHVQGIQYRVDISMNTSETSDRNEQVYLVSLL